MSGMPGPMKDENGKPDSLKQRVLKDGNAK